MLLQAHLSCQSLIFECQVLLDRLLHGDTFDTSLVVQTFFLMIQRILPEKSNLNKILFYVLAGVRPLCPLTAISSQLDIRV